MSAATCDDVNSWQREANIRSTDTLTELGQLAKISAAVAGFADRVCFVQPVLQNIVGGL